MDIGKSQVQNSNHHLLAGDLWCLDELSNFSFHLYKMGIALHHLQGAD